MMLELVSSAVDVCKSSLTDAQLDAVLEQPIVTVRHAMQATKVMNGNVAKRLDSLPDFQKLVLCLAVTACEALPAANLTTAHLRQYINEILRNDGELELVDSDAFNAAIRNLVDQGLLMPADASDKNTRTNRLGSFRETKPRFGHQLEDVVSIIGKKLAEKPVYGRLMDAIRARPPTPE